MQLPVLGSKARAASGVYGSSFADSIAYTFATFFPATSAAMDAAPLPTTAASSVHPVAAAIACPAVPRMKKLGILLSGRGTNFAAIAESVKQGRINAEIAIVISNRPEAPGIEYARKLGLDARVIPSKGRQREEHDADVVAALNEKRVDLVCMAGYMRLLSPLFIRSFPNRILNIHPSLLPAFPGLEAQKQAIEYGVKVSGCTVHFVDEHLDHGAIVVQRAVPVLDTDDDHLLASRVLEQEHIAYTEAINIVLAGNYEIVGRRVVKKLAMAAAIPQ